MKFRSVMLAATAAAPLLFAHAASAQPVTGPYIAAGAGYNLESSQKAKNIYLDRIGRSDVHITTHNGFAGGASLGYGLGNGIRVELEGDYFSNNFDKIHNGRQAPASGHETKYGAFLNAFYDFSLGLPVYPYLGAGVGYQEDNFDNFSAQGLFVNKTKSSLAYQGIAGLAVPVTPALSVTLEYRFTALANSRKFNGSYDGAEPATFKVENEYNNSIQLGLRYSLFTPQPPAPPVEEQQAAETQQAPAPAAPRTYLVFFDWDKSNLTPRALDIIAQAASDSKTQSTTTLDVSGYTDTSGTPDYNQGLSERRARAVAAQLVADGVPQDEIETHAFGETHLLVPTGPGVREPQNRRVEIDLQ